MRMFPPLIHLTLERPLAVLDLETTGIDPRNDRIVAVGVLRLAPDAETVSYSRLVNPGIPIPEVATSVHGISDDDVADRPRFKAIARRLIRLLEGSDLAGFNLRRFDLPFLVAEFDRAGVEFTLSGRAVIDVMQIYHRMEPRDLARALRFFCGRDHIGAHSALSDAIATAEVLDTQVGRYSDLRSTVAALHELLTDVDIGGRFRSQEGRVVFAVGKYLGRSLDEVARDDPGYLRWMLGQDFFGDAKTLVAEALERVDPDE